jgi:hypothetical protein
VFRSSVTHSFIACFCKSCRYVERLESWFVCRSLSSRPELFALAGVFPALCFALAWPQANLLGRAQ